MRVDVGSATISSETLDGWLESQDAAIRERVDVSRSPVADSAFIEGIGKVNLRVKIREDDANRSKTLIFVRDAGMMITDKLGSMQLTSTTRMVKSFSRRWKGFAAIVECLSLGERSLLREAEAPSHDKVNPDNADADDRAAVRKALRELGAWVHAALEKLAAPPEPQDTETLNELTDYLPLQSEDGSSVNESSANYEIAQPVKQVAAPRNLGAGKARRLPKRKLPGKPSKRRKGKNRKKRRSPNQPDSPEIVQQPLNDLRRLPHSLHQWSDHAARFAFDKPEGAVEKIELYAKGEDGKDERIRVERAFLAGRRLKVEDGALTDTDFGFVAGDRVQLEFKTVSPVNGKRLEIRATI